MEPAPSDEEGPWKRWVGYGLPAAIIAGGVVPTLVHSLTTQHDAVWVAPVEIATSLAFAAILTVGLLRLRARGPSDEHVLRLGLWCLGGTVYFGALVLLLLAGQQAAGGRIEEPGVTTVIIALGGAVVAFLVGSYDIDRLRHAEQAERLTARMRFLNRMLRHDVRNDAAVIVGNAGLLEDEVGGTEEIRYIDQAARHIDELTHLVRAFEKAEDAVDVEDVELGPMLERAVLHARDTFPTATFGYDPEPARELEVHADELLASVVENLIRNAVQHHDGTEPHVDLAVETEEDVVRIEVADDGPGIPAGIREGLFEEGVKGPGSAGTGLGLFLVRELVEAYGGTVHVAANQPRGSIFTVELRRA